MLKSNIFKKTNSSLFIIMALIVVLLTACGTTTGDEDDSPPAAVLEAQSWLAEQLNVPVEEVEIVSMEEVEWTDSCYGLGGPAELCAAVITPGWQVNFEVNGEQYEVRFDETGAFPRSPQI